MTFLYSLLMTTFLKFAMSGFALVDFDRTHDVLSVLVFTGRQRFFLL